jgi:hypothetical protein
MLSEFYALVGNKPDLPGALNAMAVSMVQLRGAELGDVETALRQLREEAYPVRLPHVLHRMKVAGAIRRLRVQP